MMLNEAQPRFAAEGLVLEAGLVRTGRKSKLGNNIQPSDCFKVSYNSLIGFSVSFEDGRELHDDEEGYCIEHLDIWVCETTLFFWKSGFLTELRREEHIAEEIINMIDELYQEAVRLRDSFYKESLSVNGRDDQFA
ncbi:hypothetical protein P4T89_10025 [Bacillus nakamurai]|uniref:Uncharacterized protein n=1 Tax=Bacillus nakamurai TaxID=1793963 RepID=A0A150F2B4_9BACI|nr:hypothetical protein [Bacillus nakamurai]KXZ13066.1 hypothetical protein AXI58_05130 [Bacillus nakamurai]MED1227912.1 hypothetical protein [Bacillus nakamurai]